MKKYFIYWTLLLLPIFTFAQKQTQEGNSVVTPLIPTSKLSLLKDVDVVFNTRMAFDNYFVDGNHTNSLFSVNQFRFEVKGKIHDKVSFRFRNRYTKIADPSTVDNISRSVDMAYVAIDIAPQTKLTIGKMIGDWGGYELLTNPIEILSYNTINDKGDNFLVGAALSYALNDHKNKFNLQLLNSRTKTFQEQFGTTVPPGITTTKIPLAAVGNWKGSFFDGKLETTYSYSYFIDAENTNRNFISLGNKYKSNKLVLYYDFQYSKEDLDQKGVVSNIIKSKYPYAAQDVFYIENWIRAEYQIRAKVNLLLTLMNDNSYWNGNPDISKENHLLASYGIIPTIEYSPFTDFNMKFYVGYVAKKYNYSAYAENNFNAIDGTIGQLSFGIIAPLLVL
ncbi:porin [Flavobacterium taihuense]|uniref:OprO/OprP family phosphate-selective porin n=1 Tax=Flavobacterium taihuense TaxID=2857508 RepID=A0ABS6XXV2_9FLAO|nr:porin [Flavobacterium taihuense]MBW4361513.1 OprO/OprP family phosphate-selective porin [Flavobacterium taihuense]